MSAAPDTSPPPLVELNMAADQAIAACGGDARKTVKALVANNFLEVQLAELRASVSAGYLRARFYPARDRKD
jgi:hypothetical protein